MNTQIIGPGKERKKIKIYNSPEEYFNSEEFKKDQQLREQQEKENNQKTMDNGLVYATNRLVYLFRPNEEDIFICERKNTITSLCYNNYVLYDVVHNEIFETLTNKPLIARDSIITSLCSHKGILYDSTKDNKIYKTESNTIIEETTNTPSGLCSNNFGLYYLVENFIILIHKLITITTPEINKHLCSHNNNLYVADIKNNIYETSRINENKIIGGYNINGLCSHNGMLLDYGEHHIINNTFKNECIKNDMINNNPITAACSIPESMVKQILKLDIEKMPF